MKEQFLNLTGLTELVGYLKTSIANHKEILPYASNKLFPSVGDINTIYIDTATNTIYRWDSSSKTYITLAKAVKSVAISEATENGKITLTVDGNKTTVPIHGLGSAAYTNSSAYSPAGHTHTKAQVGLGNVDNTADANKSVKHATIADSATTAGTATNVLATQGTNDVARHVWFSDSATETKRAYSDKFKYNPVTNNLTANITGNAATASSVAWGNVTGKPSTYAPSAHNHNDSTITSLNASKLFGTIDIARLPQGALERCVIVADDAARFKLTTANIQLGDTVKVNKTQKMYFVINESKLNSEEGYTVYTAGTATSVPWSGVTGKPSSYPPASHNHDERYYTETEMNSKLAEKAEKGHTHVKSEVGLGNVDNTADANKSVKYAALAGSATSAASMSNSGTLDTVAKLDSFIEAGKVKYATMSALDGLNGMIKNDGICISTPWTSTGYGHQFYINDNGYDLYHRFRNTTKVNNVDTPSWSSWKQILDSNNYNIYVPTKTGGGASGTWGISITGNAATATKLATARSINGTNFDGSGNITTATWGTARNVTIGNTKKSVNGGADVSWSLSEIGAAAASHSHSYLPLSGGTMSGTAVITWPDSGNWSNSNKDVTFPVVRGGLSWLGQSDGIQLYAVETGNDNLELYLKFLDDNSNGLSIRNKDNAQTARISATGIITASSFVGNLNGTASAAPWSGITGKPTTYPPSSHNHNIESLTNFSSRVYDANASRTKNTVLAAPNGSDGKASFRALVAADLPAHTHSYLPLAGGSMTGDIKFNANCNNYIGEGNTDNASAVGGDLNNLVIASWWGVSFTTPCANQKYTNKTAVGIDCRNGIVKAAEFRGAFTGNASSATALTSSAGSATQPVYFSGGKPVACTYTLAKSVPADAKFTDTNTWRGVQNNLTSTATDQSLAAAQGKVLNEKKMSAVSANGYYGMARPDNNTSDWIRTTTNGLLPIQSGARGSGHSALGTDSWYFSKAYVDHVYSTDVKIADKVTLQYDSANACLNFVFS